MTIRLTRLANGPIIGPDLHPSIGVNIQGPSLIRVPEWMDNRLGAYYLYFADHNGSYIRLAYADQLAGPWHLHPAGSLHLAESGFPGARPLVSRDVFSKIINPHIASPDVHVDPVRRRIVMYFHGLENFGIQVSRVALSQNGIDFTARPEVIGRPYMRIFHHNSMTYALTMPGTLSRSADGLRGFETGPTLFNPKMRHAAVLKRDGALLVFWTQVGDAPERILLSRVALAGDWHGWRDDRSVEVLRPERPWEGADAPIVPSVRGMAHGVVNQLRDPAIYEEAGETYLLYAVGGESGIAIAHLEFAPVGG